MLRGRVLHRGAKAHGIGRGSVVYRRKQRLGFSDKDPAGFLAGQSCRSIRSPDRAIPVSTSNKAPLGAVQQTLTNVFHGRGHVAGAGVQIV